MINVSNVKNIRGCKFQVYEDNKINIYRAIDVNEKNHMAQLKNIETSEVVNKPSGWITENMVMIEPDTTIRFLITESTEGFPDVYVVVHTPKNPAPEMVLRQDICDTTDDENVYNAGMCVNTNMLGDPKDIIHIIECAKVNSKCDIYGYVSDTLNDIVECLGEYKECLDDTLKSINARINKASNLGRTVNGYCTDIVSLMKQCEFIAHYRWVFHITKIDFPIRLTNDKSDIVLNKLQKHYLEDILQKYIENILVIEYDHDVDLKGLIGRPHIMVSDSEERIYLITYDVVANYPVDADIAQGMGIIQ